MIDAMKICAELRAEELLEIVRRAVKSAPHWRRDAIRLLGSIADLEAPEQVNAALRRIDERKRAAEVMQDVMWSDCSGN